MCQTSHKEVSTAQISPPTGTKRIQFSMNPPASAMETNTRKQSSDEARKKRQRCNEHYVAQAKRLNSGKDFQQHSARWIFQLPKCAEKVASPKFIEGMVLSESGRVKIYGGKMAFMEDAVIVQRHRESNRMNVQQPIAEPIKIGRFWLDKSPEVRYKQKRPAFQLTGSCSAPDGVCYVLVKFRSNEEIWWVLESDINREVTKNAERKARQRQNQHYLAQVERLNGGTEFQPHLAIKWIRHPPQADPVVIEGTLLSKAGRVEVLCKGKKKKAVLDCAVIALPYKTRKGRNVQQPIAEPVEINRIVSEDRPVFWSDATEPKAAEPTADAQRKRRERKNKHYGEQANKLNRGKEFQQYSAKWILQLPNGEKKVTSPTFIEGMVLSEPGNVEMYGRKNDTLEDVVIVKCHAQSNGRKDVQQPIAEPIQIGRICFSAPIQAYNKHCSVLQLTGSCSAPDGVRYVLIKFESCKETWWVPESDVSPQTVSRQRRSLKKVNYYTCKDDSDAKPPSDSAGCSSKPRCSPAGKSDHRLKKSQHVNLLTKVHEEALKSLRENHRNNGNLTIPTATTDAVESLDPKDKNKLHKDTCDLVQFSLLYSAVRMSGNMLVGIENLRQTCITERATSEELASLKSNTVRYVCRAAGCSTDAHSRSNFHFCCKHWEHKKCPKCNMRDSKRKGGLCNACFKEEMESVPSQDKLCVYCSKFGRANKPVKLRGLCKHCLEDKIQLRRVIPCADCGKNRPQRQGRICESCYKKRHPLGKANDHGEKCSSSGVARHD